jgi:hypothetical protein
VGVAVAEAGTGQLPGIDHTKSFISTKTILYRPSLAPIYGGPTLLEALWNEMDAIMERLMTGQASEDVCGLVHTYGADPCEHLVNGDKFRAQELAWVLAIVSNAYDPNVDRIRAEAVARWNSANGLEPAEADEDQDDMNTRPEGADQ